MRVSFVWLGLLVASPLLSFAQSTLSLEQAVQLALEQNFDIRIARNNQAVATNDVTWGNAGFLPRVTINGAYNINQQNRRLQSFALRDSTGAITGTDLTVVKNVDSKAGNANVQIAYTLFDGLRRTAFWERLKLLNQNTNLATAQAVERVVNDVIVAYYDIIRQEQTLRLQQGAVALATERSKLAQDREEVGAGTRLDYLQSRVDLNAANSALLRQRGSLATALVNLNELLGRSPDTGITLADTSIAVDTLLVQDQLMRELEQRNPSLLSAALGIRIAEKTLSETRGALLPTLSFTAGYTFAQQLAGQLAQGFNQFPLFTQTLGPQVGVQLTYPIFDGNNVRRRVQNARTAQATAQLVQMQTLLAQQSGLSRAWVRYRNNLAVLALESENLAVAARSVEVAVDRFKIGASTGLDLRTAQNALVDARGRLVQAQYDAKLAETELLRISGAYASPAGPARLK
jgi:outer membrane protein